MNHLRILLGCLLLLGLGLAGCNEQGSTPQGTTPPTPDPAATTSNDPGPTGPPTVRFDQDRIDFGTLGLDEVREFQFTFTNAGFSTLVIDEVTTGCDCLTLELDGGTTEYAPGESGAVNLVFAPTHGGSQTAAIVVRSNSQPNPAYKLEVWARVTQ
jgi:hypothetical protein